MISASKTLYTDQKEVGKTVIPFMSNLANLVNIVNGIQGIEALNWFRLDQALVWLNSKSIKSRVFGAGEIVYILNVAMTGIKDKGDNTVCELDQEYRF